MQIALYVLIALFLIYIGVCAVYFFSQEKLIFCPEDEKYSQPFSVEFPTTHIFFTADDGATLHGVHIAAEKSKGIIIYFHGNTGNINRWVPAIAELVKFQYDLIVIDYRGYGKTVGKRTEKKLYSDSFYFYDYAKKYFDESNIIIYGRSLGTGMAVDLAMNTNPSRLILESPFSSMLEIANKKLPIVPVSMLLKFHFRSDLKISKVKCPILLFHGTKDDVVSYESGKNLFHLGNGNKKSLMVTLQGGTHRNIGTYKEYWSNLELFLNELMVYDSK